MRLAITRAVPDAIAACELTHLDRVPIDVVRARTQHQTYEAALKRSGWTVVRLPDEPALPDSVFVEDTAVVVDEIAVITSPGAVSRRCETDSTAVALRQYRELRFLEAPAILDGGDVLRVGRSIFAGRSTRTNEEGFRQLSAILEPFGYTMKALTPTGCLHLKSAVTAFSDDGVILNPDWVDPKYFAGMGVIHVDPSEPAAANVLYTGETVLCASAFPRTAERLRAAGVTVELIDASELAKAEGALTCCSILLDAPSA